MRHGIAITLTIVFSLLLLPAFGGSVEAKLPACCRKDGKHHCMMQAEGQAGSATSMAGIGEKCPCFPRSTIASHVQTHTPTLREAIFRAAPKHLTISLRAQAGYRISHHRSEQKRGPPSFILC